METVSEPAQLLAPPSRLVLPGHEPTPARTEITFRPRSLRWTRALLSLAGFWALVPVVFLIPPHLPWALAAFALGIYFAWSNWTGVYLVREIQGSCPRCSGALTVKPGTRIRLPYRMTCYHCHHEPRLEIDAAPPE